MRRAALISFIAPALIVDFNLVICFVVKIVHKFNGFVMCCL